MITGSLSRARPSSTGLSLPEILIALLLGLLVVHLGLDSLGRFEAARGRMADRTDALVALRVSRLVLRREMRRGVGGADWMLEGDSLSIRAFRGVALVCRSDSATASLVVSYLGDRAPDPTKDSLLLVTEAGRGQVRALVGTAAPTIPCAGPDSAAAAEWRLDVGAPPGSIAVKLFERGAYHLSGSALRYQRGGSGRQPLTPEAWSSATRWQVSAGRVGVELVPESASAGPPWRGFLTWSVVP